MRRQNKLQRKNGQRRMKDGRGKQTKHKTNRIHKELKNGRIITETTAEREAKL